MASLENVIKQGKSILVLDSSAVIAYEKRYLWALEAYKGVEPRNVQLIMPSQILREMKWKQKIYRPMQNANIDEISIEVVGQTREQLLGHLEKPFYYIASHTVRKDISQADLAVVNTALLASQYSDEVTFMCSDKAALSIAAYQAKEMQSKLKIVNPWNVYSKPDFYHPLLALENIAEDLELSASQGKSKYFVAAKVQSRYCDAIILAALKDLPEVPEQGLVYLPIEKRNRRPDIDQKILQGFGNSRAISIKNGKQLQYWHEPEDRATMGLLRAGEEQDTCVQIPYVHNFEIGLFDPHLHKQFLKMRIPHIEDKHHPLTTLRIPFLQAPRTEEQS